MLAYSRVLSVTAAVLAAVVAVPAVAQDAGWIDLFDGETLFGWQSLGDAEWRVSDGNIVCTGGTGGWLATTSQFMDFELAVKVQVTAGGSTGIVFRGGLEGHPSENGSPVVLIATPEKAKPEWREVRIVAEGSDVTVTVDGEAAEWQAGSRACGYIGVQFHRTGKVEVAEAKLRPLNMKPVFNGENLEGWNILPGHKSKFAVVNGAINITDGNGQIETAGVYKDFVLQLDIISNGEHLNSGVFFRGPVGVFWKGYESQVRNQWLKDDRTKPVDYGTGGNYGNQAARKVVPNDGEWFTKTIVCHGNHASIWINGYLVSDYLDARPLAENLSGKEGYVPGPGTIHLQGHDPTTDLSFKNIRLQEYPGN